MLEHADIGYCGSIHDRSSEDRGKLYNTFNLEIATSPFLEYRRDETKPPDEGIDSPSSKSVDRSP